MPSNQTKPNQTMIMLFERCNFCYKVRERERERERERREMIIKEKRVRRWTQDNPESLSDSIKQTPKLKIVYIGGNGSDRRHWKQTQMNTHWGGFLHPCREVVGIFYSPSWLGWLHLKPETKKVIYNFKEACITFYIKGKDP